MDNLQKGEFKVKTGSEGLNLRSEPTVNSKTKDGKNNIVFSIPNGVKVTLEGDGVKTIDNLTWYNVRYTGKDKKDVTGWVANDYLEDLRPLSLPTLSFSRLYDNHPGKTFPCDRTVFKHQCACRMGVALQEALKETGFNLDSFQGARCNESLKHNPRHILRAQELADWLRKQTILVGKVKISEPGPKDAYKGKRGIIFFQNVTGLEGIDHIDVWDGSNLKNQCKLEDHYMNWVTSCEHIWFWDLRPCVAMADIQAYSQADKSSPLFIVPRSLRLEIAVVQENWVQVREEGKLGWIERGEVLFPGPSIAMKDLQAYSENTAKSSPLFTVKKDTHLEIVDFGGNWVQVRQEGKLGFIERGEVLFPGQTGYTLYTKVGKILNDPGAVQVFKRHASGVSQNLMFEEWVKGYTLKDLLAMPQGKAAGITEDMVRKALEEINARK